MDKTADILFEYLRNALYHPERAQLEVEQLPAEFQKLGMGLVLLSDWIEETKEFSMAMARGELSKIPPSVNNVLAAPMKDLQGALRHLTWQTQQVARGDFSQRVDFLGEFSDAFNDMIGQLSEKTESLIREKQRVDSMNRELRRNLDLMLALTDYTHSMIYVVASEDKRKVFLNRSAQWFERIRQGQAEKLWETLVEKNFPEHCETENWELQLSEESGREGGYFRIESYPIQWGSTPAIVHIVSDNTQQKRQENLIYQMAYVDPLTGLHNRRYAVDKMEEYQREHRDFVLTIVDLDYLKYCNDRFGHDQGDEYLKKVSMLLKMKQEGDVCRVGGDEFYILDEGCDPVKVEEELEELRTLFVENSDCQYPHSFSYASAVIRADSDLTLEEYIREIDQKMYVYKKLHRGKLSDPEYQDDRLL